MKITLIKNYLTICTFTKDTTSPINHLVLNIVKTLKGLILLLLHVSKDTPSSSPRRTYASMFLRRDVIWLIYPPSFTKKDLLPFTIAQYPSRILLASWSSLPPSLLSFPACATWRPNLYLHKCLNLLCGQGRSKQSKGANWDRLSEHHSSASKYKKYHI